MEKADEAKNLFNDFFSDVKNLKATTAQAPVEGYYDEEEDYDEEEEDMEEG